MIKEIYQKTKNYARNTSLLLTLLAGAACAQVPLEHNRQREELPKCPTAKIIGDYAYLANASRSSKRAAGKDISDSVATYEHHGAQEVLGAIDKTEQPSHTPPMPFNYAEKPKRNALGDIPSRTYSGMPSDDKPRPNPAAPYQAAAVVGLTLAAIAYFLHKGKEPEKLEFKLGLVKPEPIGPGAQHQDAPVYQPRVICKPECK